MLRGGFMCKTKLVNLCNSLNYKVRIDFDLEDIKQSMKFEGTLTQFYKSVHYSAFWQDYPTRIWFDGDYSKGYTCHIRMLPPSFNL